MTREEAEKELIAMLEEAEDGPTYSMEEVDAYMRELLHPKNQIYLTGDTHGRFERIISFCERQQVQPESSFIILGDVGLNYYGDRRDRRAKMRWHRFQSRSSAFTATMKCAHLKSWAIR